MIITLTIEDVATVVDEGTVVQITGTGEDGQRVTFAGDARSMSHVLEALVSGDEPEVDVQVEDWQVLSRETALSPAQARDLMTYLDEGTNMFGALSPDVRARLFAVVDQPSQETWEDAHPIILSAPSFTTLWQACIRYADYGVTSKPLDGPWPVVPTRDQILAALKGALA